MSMGHIRYMWHASRNIRYYHQVYVYLTETIHSTVTLFLWETALMVNNKYVKKWIKQVETFSPQGAWPILNWTFQHWMHQLQVVSHESGPLAFSMQLCFPVVPSLKVTTRSSNGCWSSSQHIHIPWRKKEPEQRTKGTCQLSLVILSRFPRDPN